MNISKRLVSYGEPIISLHMYFAGRAHRMTAYAPLSPCYFQRLLDFADLAISSTSYIKAPIYGYIGGRRLARLFVTLVASVYS